LAKGSKIHKGGKPKRSKKIGKKLSPKTRKGLIGKAHKRTKTKSHNVQKTGKAGKPNLRKSKLAPGSKKNLLAKAQKRPTPKPQTIGKVGKTGKVKPGHRKSPPNSKKNLLGKAQARSKSNQRNLGKRPSSQSVKSSDLKRKAKERRETKKVDRKLEKYLGGAQKIRSGKTHQYTKVGGVKKAEKDFLKLVGRTPIKKHGNGVKSATLSNGSKISIRPYSGKDKKGPPTLQISPKVGKQIKVRYE